METAKQSAQYDYIFQIQSISEVYTECEIDDIAKRIKDKEWKSITSFVDFVYQCTGEVLNKYKKCYS